jgi:hypothetical protein
MKTKAQPKFELTIKQPAPEGSIGFLFDYYQKKGLLELPKGIVINANKFKGNEQQDSDRG